MEPIKKNRLRFESVEPEDDPNITKYETEEYMSITEREKALRSNSSFLPWVLLVLTALVLASVIVWAVFFKGKGGDPDFKTGLLGDKPGAVDKILEKPYLPDSSLNPKLAKCINLYRDRYQAKALAECQNFLDSPGTDDEKSIALTVIGVIFDEMGRYSQAIERLRKAIDYDGKNVHAYYNLALAYKHNNMFSEAKSVAQRAKDLAPNDPKIALLAGNLLNDMNSPKEAIEAYREGLSSNPNDAYLTYNLALSQYKQGNTPEAIENFRKAIQVNPNGQIAELAHGQLGAIFFHREDLNGAEHHFREAIRIKPNDAKYLYNLGLILLKRKKTEEATAYLQKALDAGATDPQVFRYIAEAFNDLKQPESAIAALEKALRIRPDDVDTMFQLADLHYERGNLAQAELLFRKIVKSTPGDTNTENALINLGIILDDMERYSEAISSLEQALSLNPKNESAYYNLGIAYKNSGQPTKAIENWKKAASLNPSEVKYQEAVGDYYLENGFYLEAVKEYEEVAKPNPYNYRLKLKMADAYFKLKNFDLAEKSLIEVLNNSKNGEEIKLAHRKLALVYAEGDSKNKVKAKDEAYRASHIDPDDMEGRLVLAKILIDSNSLLDREKAIDELTAIVRSDVKPKTAALAYNYLGLCHYKNGEYKKAMREFQNAIDLDSNLTEAYDNKRAARASYEDSIQGRNSQY